MTVSRWTKLTRKLFRPKQIQNGSVRIDMREWTSTRQARDLYYDRHEAAERQIIEQRLRPDDIVLELGSGMGIVTISCCQIRAVIECIPLRPIPRWSRR
jgi:tRNA G37 N-methylase Trm5